MLLRQCFPLSLLTFGQQFADRLQIFHSSFTVVVAGTTCPQGLFVVLDMVFGNAAIDHAPYAAIANRQSISPFLGGLFIPKLQGLRLAKCLRNSKHKYYNK